MTPIVYILIGLGMLGLIMSVYTNPVGVLKFILIAAAIVVIGWFLYKQFIKKRASKQTSGYERAVKQSAELHKSKKHKTKKKRPSYLKVVNAKKHQPFDKKPPLSERKAEHQFTVIDGKKTKKKNRA